MNEYKAFMMSPPNPQSNKKRGLPRGVGIPVPPRHLADTSHEPILPPVWDSSPMPPLRGLPAKQHGDSSVLKRSPRGLSGSPRQKQHQQPTLAGRNGSPRAIGGGSPRQAHASGSGGQTLMPTPPRYKNHRHEEELPGRDRSCRSQGCQTETQPGGSGDETAAAVFQESWCEPLPYEPAESGARAEVAQLRKMLDHCQDQLRVSNSERQRISRQLHAAHKKIEELNMGRACEKFRSVFKLAASDADHKARMKFFRQWATITSESKAEELAMRKNAKNNYGQGVKTLEAKSQPCSLIWNPLTAFAPSRVQAMGKRLQYQGLDHCFQIWKSYSQFAMGALFQGVARLPIEALTPP